MPQRTINSRPQRFPVLPNKRARIIIEPYHHTILPLEFLLCPDNDRMSYVAPLDFVLCGDTGTACSSKTFAD